MTETPRLSRTLRRSVLGLLLFAAITAGSVGLTRLLTVERIAANQQQAAARLLHELAPPDQYPINLQQPLILPPAPELGQSQAFTAHLAWRDGQPALILLPVIAPDGYTGDIELLVALSLDGQVQGVRVVAHRETPGLGDKMETRRSDWILAFNQRSLNHPAAEGWTVRKEGGSFDQFTGATITPRAIVRAVHRSLIWLEQQADHPWTAGANPP